MAFGWLGLQASLQAHFQNGGWFHRDCLVKKFGLPFQIPRFVYASGVSAELIAICESEGSGQLWCCLRVRIRTGVSTVTGLLL